MSSALSAPGYRPRLPTGDLQEIVEDHAEELLRLYDERFASRYGPLHPRLKGLFEAFVRCGDPRFHRHCHAVCSLGVFSRDGVFHPALEDLDLSALELLLREEVFRALLEKEAVIEERLEWLRSWRNTGFHVDASRRVRSGEPHELESVLKYMVRPPVATSRLRYLDRGRVLYRGKDHPSLRTDHRVVSGLEFLALWVPHVTLRYECRIPRYGAASTTIRRAFGWIQKRDPVSSPDKVPVAEEEESGFLRLRRRSWARLIARTDLEDPELCPSCKKPMKVLAAISSPAQDEVIERVLRARGEWDPPWRRERKARAPPPERAQRPALLPCEEDVSQIREETDEEFNQEVPGGEFAPEA